jgi:hypothetical protein
MVRKEVNFETNLNLNKKKCLNFQALFFILSGKRNCMKDGNGILFFSSFRKRKDIMYSLTLVVMPKSLTSPFLSYSNLKLTVTLAIISISPAAIVCLGAAPSASIAIDFMAYMGCG